MGDRFPRVGFSRVVWSTAAMPTTILPDTVAWDGSNASNTDLTGNIAGLRDGRRRPRMRERQSLARKFQPQYTERVQWQAPTLTLYDEYDLLDKGAPSWHALFDGGATGTLYFVDRVETSGPTEAANAFGATVDGWPVYTLGPMSIRSEGGGARYLLEFRCDGEPIISQAMEGSGVWGSGLWDEAVWT